MNRRMMKILIPMILLSSFSAFAQEKCFHNDALKGTQFVRFTLNDGGKISGTFEYKNRESELAKKYRFGGALAANLLRVKFENNELPDIAPSEMRNLRWKLIEKAGEEILLIPFYGKNYETEKYAEYVVEFKSCELNYQALANRAKRIAFARGANSVKLSLALSADNQSRTFWLAAHKDQTISVKSIGCTISFFYPDNKTYEEASAIDVLTLERISQTGDYLFAIRPAGALKCLTEFKITN